MEVTIDDKNDSAVLKVLALLYTNVTDLDPTRDL